MRILIPVLSLAIAMGAVAATPPEPEGLWEQATLYRDAWGVPHVYGQNPRAAAFAFGCAQAEDHAEAMLLAYRYATGRAAEVLGPEFAPSDVFALKVGHGALAQAALAHADAITRDLCEGFALGVNAWLAEHPSEAPAWATPARPAEILALWHAYVLGFAPFDLPGAFHPLPAAKSGNAWALSPKRTAEKKTLLVISPHQYHEGPFRWYEAHLAVPGYDVAGLTLFGLPVLLHGHNALMGWALTPNRADTADVFEERLSQDDLPNDVPALYRLLMRKEPLIKYYAQTQSYKVLTPSGPEQLSTPVFLGHLGPIFEGTSAVAPARSTEARDSRRRAQVEISATSPNAGPSGLFSWSVGGYNEFGGLRQLFDMGRAGNLAAFQAALAQGQLPCFHVLYADRPGNLFYCYNARTRLKTPPAPAADGTQNPWNAPVSVELQAAALGPDVPIGKLPNFANPGRGYLQACGSPPWEATTDGPLNPGDWPAWFVNDPDTIRAQYVRRNLTAGTRSFDDMQAMVYDTYSPAAADLVPRLLAVARQRGNADLGRWGGVLQAWDFLAEPESTAMTFYDAWWTRLGEQLGTDASIYATLYGNANTAEAAALSAAMGAAGALGSAQQASAALDWGTMHQIRRGSRSEPLFGADAGGSLFLSSKDTFGARTGYVGYGFAHAMIVRFDDIPETASVSMFGTSEHPDSPHYDDQLDLVLAKRFKSLAYSRDYILRAAVEARGRMIALTPVGVEGAVLVTGAAPVTAALETLTETPSPLPQDLAAFTLFMAVRILEGAENTTDSVVTLSVPEVLCADRNLAKLELYAFTEEDGWQRAQGAAFKSEQRSWTAKHSGAGVFAVLGPTELLLPKETPQDDPSSGPTGP